MLVLTRFKGDGIRVLLPDGRAAWIIVTEALRGGRVQLGLKFPDDCGISRHELLTPEQLAEAPVEFAR